MPELPEVETIARYLRDGKPEQPSILGRIIRNAELFWLKTLAEPDLDQFLSIVPGQKIQGVGRRGKFLKITLSQGYLFVHLRMSGDLFTRHGGQQVGVHDRLVFDLDEQVSLVFQDSRKFGRVWWVEDPDELVKNLGPEPLEDRFTPEIFGERLKKFHRQLKPLLMDQSFLAGLGNIYTDEALHLAQLHPLTISDTLTFTQAERLWKTIRQALRAGIERNGTSIDWVYRGGDYQKYLQVYRRTGEPCLRCGTPIERIVIGQRSTHFCPVCQKLK
jgi:formamidopyrimidine-DNA glycosylase